ncbi:PREDICTED: uncharacterized protein LOC107087150 isoform X2 [Cyprinodon variegatus]|uniref:uncharacterized protein LOC107087150 isoform X2 n=1 Tax=Cyprinodon variegatus TaxID=28743 RepID=UPI0007429666|nr:PREDICTED: uncharacterized protein LOC107087150 isoform X2 [Cyprinodon variegatus]
MKICRKRSLLQSSYVEKISGDGKLSTKPEKNTESTQDVGKKKKRKSIAKKDGTWLVTCENKEGVMDLKKLERGENCIECEGLWFTPPAFEDLAGKGSCKKWKRTIFHEGRPLGHFFSEGILSTVGYLRRRSEPMRKVEVPLRKDRRKSTNAVTFQGTRSRKYRSFNSVTQIKVSSEMTDIKSTEDPDMSTAKGSDALDNGHRSNLDGEQEPKQRKTTEEDVLSAPESAKDHNTTEERCYDPDNTTAEKRMKMKSQLIIKRLSMKRTYKTRGRPKDSWCEPLDNNTENNDPKDATEAVGKRNAKELNGKDDNLTAPPEEVTVTSDHEDRTELPAAPLNLTLCVNDDDSDKAESENGETELEGLGTSIQLSNGFHASEIETKTTAVSGGSDVDSLDLDQLKKEKIKMQLKVLRLQEEYYTLMLKDLKTKDLNCSNEN